MPLDKAAETWDTGFRSVGWIRDYYVEFTLAVKRACDLMGIELYDHVIVTDDGFTSLRERGLI